MVTGLWFSMFGRVMLKGELKVGILIANALVYDKKCVGVLFTLLPWFWLLSTACYFIL